MIMAGRDLDALVAEKFFRWDSCDGTACPPAFSTKIAAAWEVVEKLDLFNGAMLGKNAHGQWAIWDNADEESPVFAETAPLAICLAALHTNERNDDGLNR